MLIPIFITIVAGYFIGAIPVGYLVARSQGINIFGYGSGNPGATNVMRALGEKYGARGKKFGYLVFVLDGIKGATATGWPIVAGGLGLFDGTGAAGAAHLETLGIIGLAAAMLGNSYSCFTRFKGGKGVSTGAGGFMVLMPVSIVIALLVWWAVFEAMRYVSLASIIATASLPVTSLVMNLLWGGETRWVPSLVVVGISAVATVFVAVRHRSNISRLVNGTENKFVRKRAG